jgi:hypothetical protein
MRLSYNLSLLILSLISGIPVYTQNVGIGVPNPLQKLHVGGSIRADGLASAGTGMITTNANGDLLRTNFSGNVNDVLRGNGTFGAAATLPSGAMITSTNPNDQTFLAAGFSFYGELSLPAITYYAQDVGLSQQFTQAPVYETGNPAKIQALSERAAHSSVWTGTEMITWGGFYISSDVKYTYYDDGARYNPSTDTWTMMSAVNAPVKSAYHSTAWTGTEMIVWGGLDSTNVDFFGNQTFFFHNSGKRYNPASNTWINITTTGAPSARARAPAVWTGTNMVVWGGNDGAVGVNDGGRYNPVSNTWSPVSAVNAPVADFYTTRIFWTGTYAIILGHQDTMARYNPAINTWLISAKCPAGIFYNKNAAVWTGTELWVYEPAAKRMHKYNPVTNVWSNVLVGGFLFPETSFSVQSSIWSDAEMILFGNVIDAEGNFQSNRCYNYNPGTNTFHTGIGSIRYNQRVTTEMSFIKAGSMIIKWGGYLVDFDPNIAGARFNRQGMRIYLSSGISIPTAYLRSTFDNKLYLYRKN